MKRIIKYWPVAFLLVFLSSCSVSDTTWDVIHDLPQTDGVIEPDPWDGQDSEAN